MDQDNRPTPDPTILTTEALTRGLSAERDYTDGKFNVVNEKLSAIDRQLKLVETQRIEQKKDTKDAVDAALTAQKEAVKEQTIASDRAISKSEAATTKAIEQQGSKFEVAIESLRRETTDLKERVSAREGNRRGNDRMLGMIVGISGAVFGLVGVISAVISSL